MKISKGQDYNAPADRQEWAEVGGIDRSPSDGYHTFDELYDHRIALFIALCRSMNSDSEVWRSKLHADGSGYENWFIMGIGKEKGRQISYHLPMIEWGATTFAETLDRAPEWDGHTPNDVINRLKSL